MDVAGVLARHARLVRKPGGARDRGVVHQFLPDARQVAADLDAHVGQMAGRADAGAEQVRRRMHRAAAQHHLAGHEGLRLAAPLGLDAHGAQAVEKDLAHLGLGADFQILAQPGRRVEIADGRRDPAVVEVRHRDREMPVLEDAVLVREIGVAEIGHRLRHGLGVGRPFLLVDAPDRDAPVAAVQLAVEVHVALELAEKRQAGFPAPALRALAPPVVIVVRRAPVGHLPVDRRPAAHDPRLLVVAQFRLFALGQVLVDRLEPHPEPVPSVVRVEIGRAGIARMHVGRYRAVGRVDARLQQKDPVGAPGRKPVRHDRAGGPAADDDVVVLHRKPPGRHCSKRTRKWEGLPA